jgi:hypothetical protein
LSIWAYAVIAVACIGIFLVDIRGVRIYRALRVRGVPVKARCIGIDKEKNGRYTMVFRYVYAEEGLVYQFKEANYKTPPVDVGEELDALHDPARYAPPSLASRHTLRRAFPYPSCVALPVLIAVTIALVGSG